MDSIVRLDLIHTSPVVTTALRARLHSGDHHVRVDTAVHSWTDFQTEWDFAGEVVLIDALLDDHVPLALKIRALRRLDSRVIVLGPGRDSRFARRAAAEGALAWIEPTLGLAETVERIRAAAEGRPTPDTRVTPAGPPLAQFTDRELQVLALFVAARGHPPAHLGRVLSHHLMDLGDAAGADGAATLTDGERRPSSMAIGWISVTSSRCCRRA
jgi:DNA-binding NarL/FixJ family response regulator